LMKKNTSKVESFLLLNISRLHYNSAVFYLNIIDHFYV